MKFQKKNTKVQKCKNLKNKKIATKSAAIVKVFLHPQKLSVEKKCGWIRKKPPSKSFYFLTAIVSQDP